MKTNTSTRMSNINGQNRLWLDTVMAEPDAHLTQINILRLIADMLDEIHKGRDMYMVIGTTMKRDVFSINVKGEHGPGAVYATDMAALSDAVEQFLDPVIPF